MKLLLSLLVFCMSTASCLAQIGDKYIIKDRPMADMVRESMVLTNQYCKLFSKNPIRKPGNNSYNILYFKLDNKILHYSKTDYNKFYYNLGMSNCKVYIRK